MTVFRPQPGPQTSFLACPADVVVFGGSAGGGKTYALQLEMVRHHKEADFTGLVLRRKMPQIESPGGLWDTSRPILTAFGARPRGKPTYDARFPSTALIKFSHLEQEKDLDNYQGAEIAFIAFEEATQFTRRQFNYMLSRNRSRCSVRGYMRLTCNPDPDSYVAELVAWYLDDGGFPHPDKSGRIRYFAQEDGDAYIWGATREEVVEQSPRIQEEIREGLGSIEELVLSFAFIPAKLEDNPALIAKDPGYRAKLNALSYVDRMRLLGGNWFVRESAGTMFRREWFNLVDDYPRDARIVRYWDLAGSKRRRSDPTAGVKVAEKDGRFWLLDVKNRKGNPHETEGMIGFTAAEDGHAVDIGIEQEIGGASLFAIDALQRGVLKGFSVYPVPIRGEGTKIERAKPLSAAAQAGNVSVLRGAWNDEFFRQAEAFPEGAHDDIIDAGSGGMRMLTDVLTSGFYWRGSE